MTVRDTSLSALAEIAEKLGPDESAVLAVLDEIGPASDKRILEALNQKEQVTLKPKRRKRVWQINSVTGRRNALVNKYGVVEDLGAFKKDGRKAVHIWRSRGDSRRPEQFGFKPARISLTKRPNPAEQREHLQQIKEKAGQPVLHRLRASEAGRTLVEYRHSKHRKQTVKTNQRLLFAP